MLLFSCSTFADKRDRSFQTAELQASGGLSSLFRRLTIAINDCLNTYKCGFIDEFY